MKWAVAGFIVLAGLIAGTAEWLAGVDRSFRVPVYIGGFCGWALGVVGLIFALKLAGFKSSTGADGRFWVWWGIGMLVRLGLGGAAVIALFLAYEKQPLPALLALSGVYLVTILAEAGWLAKMFFNEADKMQLKQRTNN